MSQVEPDFVHIFSSECKNYRVVLSHLAMDAIINACLISGKNETGGILIGHYSDTGKLAIVQEASSSPEDSLHGRATFQRGKKGLKELLNERWSLGMYYLGEWHFHPGGSPEPSSPDIKAMNAIAADASYNCKAPVLIIAGGWSHQLTLSANIFIRGEQRLPLKKMPQ